MIKAIIGFVVGGVLCGGAVGWAVWQFKPSSIESTTFAALSSAFDIKAAKLTAQYEAETKALAVELDAAEERVADAEERSAAVRARHERAVIRLGKDVEAKSDEIADLKESEGRTESLEALVRIVRRENDLYADVKADLMRELALKDGLIARMETYIASRDVKIDVLERMVESRDTRIKELGGRRLRWGPGASAGWSPFTGQWAQATVGIVGCYC